jgi:hypothetical protein
MVDLILELGKIAREESGEALAKIASAVLKFFHTDAAAVLLYDPSVRSAYVAASISKSDSLLVQSDITLRVTSGSSLYQAALNPTRPLIVPAEAGDPVLGAAGGMTAAVIPMVYSGLCPGSCSSVLVTARCSFGTTPTSSWLWRRCPRSLGARCASRSL